MNLRPGSGLRARYIKIPFPLTFKVYIFNVTNYIDVSKGQVPRLDEIGPYAFE